MAYVIDIYIYTLTFTTTYNFLEICYKGFHTKFLKVKFTCSKMQKKKKFQMFNS